MAQSPHPTPQRDSAEAQLGLERIVFFSDAVMAIAITVLVLDIKLPGEIANLNDVQLLSSLTGIAQEYLAYAISFLVIGIFWVSHHRKFQLIQRYDYRLVWLNLLALMAIAFIPFPSSVISANSNRTATIFYALTIVIVSLTFTALWWYASAHHRLVHADLTREETRHEFARPVATGAVFLCSIGIALFDADLAKYSWLLLIPVLAYISRH